MNIYALLAGLLSGIAGSMGLGGGTFLIVYLSLFTDSPQMKNQGINLIFFIPIAVFSVAIYIKKKEIKFKTVIPIAIGGLIGCILGIYFAKLIGVKLLSKLFGGFLCALGAKEVLTFKKSK